MKVQVSKWGNSLAVRLPKSITERAGISEGTLMDIDTHKGNVTLVQSQRTSLADLLKDITAQNRHESVSTGDVRGNEVW